ncbi:hypothetical protein BHM03_00006535 [Ensete ventricosum]|nr:hypothetical protein BHM03_00006535 [Ensete ventricosum]
MFCSYLQRRSVSDKSFSYEVSSKTFLYYDDANCLSGIAAPWKFEMLQLHETESSIIVKQGMLHSRGELLLMLDADGATKITDLEKLESQVICTLAEKVKELNPGDQSMKLSDIEVAAFGSRARLEKQALTTCGFKLFTRAAARKLFTNMRLKRYFIIRKAVFLFFLLFTRLLLW